jgi:hypothetical protein
MITNRLITSRRIREVNKLLFMLLFVLFIQTSWGQTQNIGEFPGMNGGFETAVPGVLGGSNVVTGTQFTDWKYSTAAISTVGINSTITRSGAKSIDWASTSTSSTLITPTAPSTAIASSTSYVIQYFWYKNNTGTARKISAAITADATAQLPGTVLTATVLGTAAASTSWSKETTIVTSGIGTAVPRYGFAQFRPSGGSFSSLLIDDFVIYAGTTADIIAPSPATSPSTNVVSGTSLNVNWTGTQFAGDNGGYVVVRSTSPTAITLNQNGIYGVGNTSATGGGTIVAIVPGVTGLNTFTDTGLTSGVTYYYSIFAADKAFNYSTAVTCIGTPISGLTPPVLIADTTLNNVDNNIDITFTDDSVWRAAITAVKIGGTPLIPNTDYVITAGNLQLKPAGLNVLLTTAGSKAVTVDATGYATAAVTQLINPGAPTSSNSTATISAFLTPGTTQTITIIARDQYNNLVSGYNFVYDLTIANTTSTTAESYIIDGITYSSTTANAIVSTATNGSGVTTITATLPSTIDQNDGLSIQLQLADGLSNVGSPFVYYQLPSQTITFATLPSVAYGDPSFTLTATASSGLAITYSSSNTAVATVTGNTVNILTPGTTTITAIQSGNSSFAATTTTQVLTVTPKSITIASAVASNKVFNGNTAAVITGTLSGVINSDVVTFTGTGAFATSNVGTGIAVTASCTLGGANAAYYTLVQPTGLFADITKANQVINFIGPLLNYIGFADFAPPASSATSALSPITFSSSDPNVATIVGNQVRYVGPGITTITASQAASPNYNAASLSRTLTVMAMPIAAWNFWTTGSSTQTNVAAYLYDTGLDSTTNNTGLPATNSATSLPPRNITRGAGVTASGGTSTVRSTGFPTTAPTPPTVDAANTRYFQVTLRAGAPGKTVSLSTIDAFFYDAGNGFNAAPGAISQFGYSLDGGITMVPIANPVQSTALRMGQIDVSTIAALQDVPFGTTITLRYYASGYAAQGWGFGSPNPGATAGIAATDGLVLGGDVSDSTTWTTGLVWTNGIPTATKNAIILGAFDTSVSTGGGFTAKKITINPGGSLLIKAGTSITVQNQVINNAGVDALTIENTGSLIQVNDATPGRNIGTIKYSRQTTPISNFDYTYWSSPVSGFTLGGVSPNTLSDKYFSYNSTIQNWSQETSATVMTPGVGYIIRGPQLSTYMAPNPPAPYLATFSGVPNNGRQQITGLVANKLYLIGNPYPSALDADAFINGNLNVLNGTLYFWTHNTPIDNFIYAQNDYASYNLTGSVATASAALNPGVSSLAPTGKIGSCQGFFANSKDPGLTNGFTAINFYNTMRVGFGGITGNNSQFFRSAQIINTNQKNRIWLNMSNAQGAFKQLLVGYLDEATNAIDSRFDGESLNANQYIDFYSINQDKNLVIQGRALPFDINDQVRIGFSAGVPGIYTLSIENTDGIFDNQSIFIEDLLTNTITNLKNENYTFSTAVGTFNDRFVLKYITNSALQSDTFDANRVLVYKNSETIYVNAGAEVLDNIKVYDLQGRLINEQKNVNATSATIKTTLASNQILLVKITTQKQVVLTRKVF